MNPTHHHPEPSRTPANQAARKGQAGQAAAQRPNNPRPAAGDAARPEVAVVAVLGYN